MTRNNIHNNESELFHFARERELKSHTAFGLFRSREIKPLEKS